MATTAVDWRLLRSSSPRVLSNSPLGCSAAFQPQPHPAFKEDVEKKTDKNHGGRKKTQNLQDTFLNYVRKNKTPLTIFLINGVKLQGIVSWFDNFCVLLRRDGHSQLVYKHAISTIMPGGPVNLNDQDGESGAG